MRLAGAGEVRPRSPAGGRRPALAKVFDVGIALLVPRDRRFQRSEHRIGNRSKESVSLAPRRWWQPGREPAAALVVEMQVDAVRVRPSWSRGRPCRRAIARTTGLPATVLRGQQLRDAPDRRDADAAGEENHLDGILDEWKIIAWRTDSLSVCPMCSSSKSSVSRRGSWCRA